jgi:hypothetical protein
MGHESYRAACELHHQLLREYARIRSFCSFRGIHAPTLRGMRYRCATHKQRHAERCCAKRTERNRSTKRRGRTRVYFEEYGHCVFASVSSQPPTAFTVCATRFSRCVCARAPLCNRVRARRKLNFFLRQILYMANCLEKYSEKKFDNANTKMYSMFLIQQVITPQLSAFKFDTQMKRRARQACTDDLRVSSHTLYTLYALYTLC